MFSETKLEKLTAEYRATFPQKKDQLETAFSAIIDNNWSLEALSELKHLAHKLSGSTGAYGFSELSNLIQSLEKALEKALENSKQNNAEKEVISRIFSEVIEQFERN
jgi:HPt (histidine-containing phosphotransfer) domain-containing protein